MLLVGQPYPDVVIPEGAQPARIGVVEAAGYAHKVSLKMYSSIWEAVVQPRKEPMSVKEIGGPVAVYEFTESARKRSVETGDWGFLIDWIAFFSINLGVINLLPIPVLDGGHIGISMVEGIRRKKLEIKTRNVLNIIGAVMVFGIFALAISSDLLRLLGN
tara:strand:- start:255 stop:734 length:480 start_codon:yes stop_codon:yes gene_type:complete